MVLQAFKQKMRERFFRYDSWVYPLYFWKRFPLYHIPALMFERLLIYSFLGRDNRVLSVRFPPLKGLRMQSYTAFLGGLRYFGWWENEVRPILRTYIPKAKSFIEIGAMEGFYEVIARKLNPSCAIIAVEPEAGARELIEHNFRINGLDSHDRISFRTEFVSDASREGYTTISKLVENQPNPVFLLMDIDGGEKKALMGGLEELKKTPVYFLIETHSPELETSCVSILENLGYTVSIIKNAWWRRFWPEERPAPQNGKHHNRWLFATNIR